ncbi:hypothetical protein CROQUDRAFT_144762 [Cronartium quercuum f. sp. fusiforme G11]|uniref:Uncharacterized protein n=1 Tax=Cronartium quercuum f. sp. fusiforme G11 TaxID=708437 RepID=A0A9P6NZX0_9BASI|nr:hypothetical protein CROQUDRAFT_144762 [Cronartium quercuum f. sp. fusiforme G11]
MVSPSSSPHQVNSHSNPQHPIDLKINLNSPSSIKTNSVINENLESTSALHLDPALYERHVMPSSRQPALPIGKSPLHPPCDQPSGSGHSPNTVQTTLMPNSSVSRSAAAPSLQSMLATPNCSPVSPVVVSGSIPTNSMNSTIPMPTRSEEAQNRDTTCLKQAQEQGPTVSPADRPAPGFCYSPPVTVSIGILPAPSPTLFGIPFIDGFSCAQRAQLPLFRPNVEDSNKPMVLPPHAPENHQRPTPNPSSTRVPASRRSVVIDLTSDTSPSASSIEFVEPVSKNRPNPAVSTKLSRSRKLGPEAGSSRGIRKPVTDSSSRTGHHPSPRNRSRETSCQPSPMFCSSPIFH